MKYRTSVPIRPIPRSLLRSKYRRTLWKNTERIIAKLKKVLPMSEIYLLGSFSSTKRRPADVDFIILIKTKIQKNANWSVDVVFAPDNPHGSFILADAKKWMRQKYGTRKSTVIRIA